MFAFDDWADWLKNQTSELDAEKFSLVQYHDSRPFPETHSNPSFGLSLDSNDRIGFIGFWKVGLCDYTVIDVSSEASEADLANEAGLDATDETVPLLFAKFMSFYH